MKYFLVFSTISLNINASNILFDDNNRIFKCKNKLVYIDLKNLKLTKHIVSRLHFKSNKCKDFNIDWLINKM